MKTCNIFQMSLHFDDFSKFMLNYSVLNNIFMFLEFMTLNANFKHLLLLCFILLLRCCCCCWIHEFSAWRKFIIRSLIFDMQQAASQPIVGVNIDIFDGVWLEAFYQNGFLCCSLTMPLHIFCSLLWLSNLNAWEREKKNWISKTFSFFFLPFKGFFLR